MSTWALAEYIPTYSNQFDAIQKNGKVTGGAAKGVLSASGKSIVISFHWSLDNEYRFIGLPTATLKKIWDLSDIDRDGQLDLHEFVIALFITDMVKQGAEVPQQLDSEMYPPGKGK